VLFCAYDYNTNMVYTTLKPTDFLILGTTVFVVVGGIGFSGWLRILKETNKLLKEQNVELKSENDGWKSKHEENIKALASMQGQIDVLKSIPLVNIDTTLKEIAKFNKNLMMQNNKILESLQASADSVAKAAKDTATTVAKVKNAMDAN
jgi:hypothetical protein